MPLTTDGYFNPQGSREPRRGKYCAARSRDYFNPQGSREPRQKPSQPSSSMGTFQSTRLSRASTLVSTLCHVNFTFQSTRLSRASTCLLDLPFYAISDFNPQGSREPRLVDAMYTGANYDISIHKALASLDVVIFFNLLIEAYFNPQGSREPRRQKCTIILASMPHLHASYYTSSTNRLSS